MQFEKKYCYERALLVGVVWMDGFSTSWDPNDDPCKNIQIFPNKKAYSEKKLSIKSHKECIITVVFVGGRPTIWIT